MKAKHGIIVVLFSVLIILSGKQALTADTSAGKIIFKNNCQFCHMIEGDGNYRSAYYMQYRPKDFSNSNAWKKLTEKKNQTCPGERSRGNAPGPPERRRNQGFD